MSLQTEWFQALEIMLQSTEFPRFEIVVVVTMKIVFWAHIPKDSNFKPNYHCKRMTSWMYVKDCKAYKLP
jgi:hypothetical protein